MIIGKIYLSIYKFFSTIKWRKRLKLLGKNSFIKFPLAIENGKYISIFQDVYINTGCWLATIPNPNRDPELVIHKGCVIGHYNEFAALNSIIIEEDVITADRVYISDNLHGYEDINVPIHEQPIIPNGNGVVIGAGSWIGINVSILGASIGKHSIVGANSVVTKDIPDYCIAVGVPAKIIKRYCFEKKLWLPTNSDGTFKLT